MAKDTTNEEDQGFRVNVDFPQWMLELLDKEASRLGIPRQAVIKVLLDRGLKEIELERKTA